MDLQSLLGSLGGLQSLISGRRGGAQPAMPMDDTASLTGNDLEQRGLDLFEGQHRNDVESHRAIQTAAGDPRADFNASDENIMGSSIRSPAWASFFGLMRGKKMNDFGHADFAEGRLAPGTDDTIEQVGPTFDSRDFESGNIGPGSIAGRSGLSQQALRVLAGGK